MTKQEMIDEGLALDVEFPEMWDLPEDEEDFLTGKTCNPEAPEECEACQ